MTTQSVAALCRLMMLLSKYAWLFFELGWLTTVYDGSKVVQLTICTTWDVIGAQSCDVSRTYLLSDDRSDDIVGSGHRLGLMAGNLI